jgi:hypothetical protein
MPEPQKLQDARSNESHAQDELYEACLAFVNAGLTDGSRAAVIYPDSRGLINVISWARGENWNAAMDNVARRVALASAARKHRKQIQQNIIEQSPADDDFQPGDSA